jgi:hypothetical protein
MNGIPGLRIPEMSATRYVITEPTGSKHLFKEKVMTLAERPDTIRQGTDKRIPPDKARSCIAPRMTCARRTF